MNYGDGMSGYPQQGRSGVTMQKLRRFSESAIVSRAIMYLRGQIGRLPWQIKPVEGVRLNRAQKRALAKVTKLLKQPNPDDGWFDFIGQVIEEACVIGWAPIEVRRLKSREAKSLGDGDPATPDHTLWPQDGSSYQVNTKWSGDPNEPRYAQVLADGRKIPFKNADLVFFRWRPRTNTPFGLAPVESSFNEIEYLLSAEAYAGRATSNVTPKKLLHVKDMTSEQRQEFMLWWKQMVEGNASIPMIGGEAVESIELGAMNDENLFLKWQTFLIGVIAANFGIDVHKFNIILAGNRSTSDKLDETTDSGAIEPLCTMIEEVVNQRILALYGLADLCEFRFIHASSISDQKGQAVVSQVELQADMITIDEARARRGLPPLVHPKTGEPLGQYTLTAYRAMFNAAKASVDGPGAAVEQADELAEAQLSQDLDGDDERGEGFENGENSNNTKDDKASRGGNGVHSAKKPKDKAYNRRTDGTELT